MASLLLLLSRNDKTKLPKIDILKLNGFDWDKKEECTIVFSFDGESVDMPAGIEYGGGHSARYEKLSFL